MQLTVNHIQHACAAWGPSTEAFLQPGVLRLIGTRGVSEDVRFLVCRLLTVLLASAGAFGDSGVCPSTSSMPAQQESSPPLFLPPTTASHVPVPQTPVAGYCRDVTGTHFSEYPGKGESSPPPSCHHHHHRHHLSCSKQGLWAELTPAIEFPQVRNHNILE